MANTKNFIVKNGISAPSVEVISPDATKIVEINVTNTGELEFTKDNTPIFSVGDTNATLPYDNTTSGLTATTIQDAIDELKTSISGSSTWGNLKGV